MQGTGCTLVSVHGWYYENRPRYAGSKSSRGGNLEHTVRLHYPDHDQIADPTQKLTKTLKTTVGAIITGTIAFLRTNAEKEEMCVRQLCDDAAKIFNLVAGQRSATFPDAESFRVVLMLDADLAVRAMHFAYQQAYTGRMLYFRWHQGIEQRLDEEAERFVTQWWAFKADITLVVPNEIPHVRTKAPPTLTRSAIEAFLTNVENETGIKVNKTDFWLYPQKNGKNRYSSDREFRAFQGEDPNLSPVVKRAFSAVLKVEPKEFVKGLEERRQACKARKKQKVRH
jgi:hypothetical protein